MSKKKNVGNVLTQAALLEEEVLAKDREIINKDRELVNLKRENSTLERRYSNALADQAEAAIENDARVLKYKVATVLSTVVAVVMVVVNII